MTGRPTVMTADVKAAILARLAEGESLRRICASDDMPAASTVHLCLLNDKPFSEQYARAREMQAEQWSDEILDIADDGTNDCIERENKDGSTYEAVNHDHISRSKLRVDTRKWLMSKLLPKKYGDRLMAEHSGPDGGPIEISDTEAARRIAAMLVGATKG